MFKNVSTTDQPAANAAAFDTPQPDDDLASIGSFYPRPPADEAIGEALARCFADGSWGRYHGPHCEELRADLAELHKIAHVILCSSGTVAVELALRGLKVTAGDEVILAAYDFPGNFRAIEALGARPVLVDIDPRTWCLDPANLPGAVSDRTRTIVVSHLHGGMADMPAIMAIASKHGLGVVEDACQSPAATVAGRMAGTWGDVGVLSFGGSKLLTAGRGGALLTPRAEVEQRIKVFTHRGNDAFPLSELQAAVLIPQLQRLQERNRQRRAAVERILVATSNAKLLQPLQNSGDAQPSFYKLAWLFGGDEDAGVSRDVFLARAQANKIPLGPGFRGFAHRSSRRCRAVGDLRHSTAAADHTIVLHHPVLLATEAEVDDMVNRLNRLVEQQT